MIASGSEIIEEKQASLESCGAGSVHITVVMAIWKETREHSPSPGTSVPLTPHA